MRITPDIIKSSGKANIPIVCLTAYSAPMAKMADRHADLILVGDSIGMVLYGMGNTNDVTLDIMIAHGAAVVRGADNACIVVDMPYGTYEDNKDTALLNARRVIDETGCDAVKLEGGMDMAHIIAHLVQNGVPVMGHIGLQPQSAILEGGFKIKGKTDEGRMRLIDDARAIEAAGVFSFVLEGTVHETAAMVSTSVSIPCIGIGASPACDGQILVSEDLLGLTGGLSGGHVPKFVKQYADLNGDIDCAFGRYTDEVRARAFPTPAQLYNKPKKKS